MIRVLAGGALSGELRGTRSPFRKSIPSPRAPTTPPTSAGLRRSGPSVTDGHAASLVRGGAPLPAELGRRVDGAPRLLEPRAPRGRRRPRVGKGPLPSEATGAPPGVLGRDGARTLTTRLQWLTPRSPPPRLPGVETQPDDPRGQSGRRRRRDDAVTAGLVRRVRLHGLAGAVRRPRDRAVHRARGGPASVRGARSSARRSSRGRSWCSWRRARRRSSSSGTATATGTARPRAATCVRHARGYMGDYYLRQIAATLLRPGPGGRRR